MCRDHCLHAIAKFFAYTMSALSLKSKKFCHSSELFVSQVDEKATMRYELASRLACQIALAHFLTQARDI